MSASAGVNQGERVRQTTSNTSAAMRAAAFRATERSEPGCFGLTLVRPKRLLEGNGELRVPLPLASDVPAQQLAAALSALS